MISLHGEVKKIDSVDEGRTDVVERIKGGIFEDNDVHVEEAEEYHEELPSFGRLYIVYFFVEPRF